MAGLVQTTEEGASAVTPTPQDLFLRGREWGTLAFPALGRKTDFGSPGSLAESLGPAAQTRERRVAGYLRLLFLCSAYCPDNVCWGAQLAGLAQRLVRLV